VPLARKLPQPCPPIVDPVALGVGRIIDDLRAHGSDLAESTIRTHITSRMCGDSPDHHGTTYDDLERVDRGVYRLDLAEPRETVR
jgi:hypothetical protein